MESTNVEAILDGEDDLESFFKACLVKIKSNSDLN